jgi:hypothetical protein
MVKVIASNESELSPLSNKICLNEKSHLYNPNLLLSTGQASEMLGVTDGTLSVWRATKRYPLVYVKCGRLVKYRVADILEFISSRSVFADTKEVS